MTMTNSTSMHLADSLRYNRTSYVIITPTTVYVFGNKLSHPNPATDYVITNEFVIPIAI